jgi:hypothetical protein
MKKLSALINELESWIPHNEKLNTAVSQASVGWHIQHSLLAALQIIQAVEKSNPENYRWKFNLSRAFVYTFNKIPRGSAKAPESVLPKEAINSDEMKKNIELLKTRLGVLKTLQPNHYFKHPYFGHLNVKAAIKMLKLHTNHHISIINDIIKG